MHALAKAARENDAAQDLLIELCEWLGFIRRDLYMVHNKSHLGSGGAAASRRVKHLLDEYQTALANQEIVRQDSIRALLKDEFAQVTVGRYGTLEYEILGRNDFSDNVNALISARNDARASKNWAESDRIRDELAAMGIALKDNKDGTTTWEVKR